MSIALANPLNSSADEQAQTIKAAAAARFQFKGFRTNATGYSAGGVPVYFYKLPKYYEGVSPSYKMLLCELGYPDQAVCHQAGMGGSYNGYSSSYVGSYNPFYNFIVGIPTLVLTGNSALYCMQFVSGAFCCIALSLGLTLFFHRRRRKFAKGFIVMGLTPVLIYYAVQINPSGFEICFSFMEWCSGLYIMDLLYSSEDELPKRSAEFRYALIAFWLSVITLILSRPDSFVFAFTIFGTVLVITKSKSYSLGYILKQFKSLLIYVAVLSLVFDLEWIRLNPVFIPGNLREKTLYHYGGFGYILDKTLHVQLERINFYSQMFNGINYLTTKFPIWYFVAYLMVLGVSLIFAYKYGNRYQAIMLTAMVIAVFVLTVVFDQVEYSRLEIAFQFRYILPYELGFPIIIAYILDKHASNYQGSSTWDRIAYSGLATFVIFFVMLIGYIETFYYDWRFQLFTLMPFGTKAVSLNTWIPPDGVYGSIGFELLAILIFLALVIYILNAQPIIPESRGNTSESTLLLTSVLVDE